MVEQEPLGLLNLLTSATGQVQQSRTGAVPAVPGAGVKARTWAPIGPKEIGERMEPSQGVVENKQMILEQKKTYVEMLEKLLQFRLEQRKGEE